MHFRLGVLECLLFILLLLGGRCPMLHMLQGECCQKGFQTVCVCVVCVIMDKPEKGDDDSHF